MIQGKKRIFGESNFLVYVLYLTMALYSYEHLNKINLKLTVNRNTGGLWWIILTCYEVRKSDFFLWSHQLHVKILTFFFFLYSIKTQSIFSFWACYVVGFFSYFSCSCILRVICVDSEEPWSGRSLIEHVIYSKEVIPNLFQQAGIPGVIHTQTVRMTYIYTQMFSLDLLLLISLLYTRRDPFTVTIISVKKSWDV